MFKLVIVDYDVKELYNKSFKPKNKITNLITFKTGFIINCF